MYVTYCSVFPKAHSPCQLLSMQLKYQHKRAAPSRPGAPSSHLCSRGGQQGSLLHSLSDFPQLMQNPVLFSAFRILTLL